MILPASQEKYGPIADKVTSIIADAATSVGRFEVIDRNLVDEILEEQAFQMSGTVSDEQVVEFGEMAAAEEALIINIVHFGQKGVPKAKKEGEDDKDDNGNEKTRQEPAVWDGDAPTIYPEGLIFSISLRRYWF